MDKIETEFIEKASKTLFAECGNYSVGVAKLDSEGYSECFCGKDGKMRSASVIKLYILLSFLRYKKMSGTDLSGSEFELIHKMITESDNDATNTIIDKIGIDRVNRTCNKLGFESTKLERKMLDFKAVDEGKDNYTSAVDTIHLLHSVYTEEYDKDMCDTIYCTMKEQKNRTKLASLLPSGIIFAGKSGELDPEPNRGGVENDTAIIDLGGTVLFIAVFISDVYDSPKACEAMGRFSKALCDLYK